MPQVTWWRDSHLIDSSFEKTYSHTVQNTLSVPQVTREDLGAALTCQASNNNISAPASARVTIDLKCKIDFISLKAFAAVTFVIFKTQEGQKVTKKSLKTDLETYKTMSKTIFEEFFNSLEWFSFDFVSHSRFHFSFTSTHIVPKVHILSKNSFNCESKS